MSVVHDVLLYANLASAAVALVAITRWTPRQFMRGRYISRPAIRRLGLLRAVALRLVVLAALVVFGCLLVGGVLRVYPVEQVIALWWNLWVIDDWLARERKPRRKHEWARIRLRMPRPVKLRPAERWNPSPA